VRVVATTSTYGLTEGLYYDMLNINNDNTIKLILDDGTCGQVSKDFVAFAHEHDTMYIDSTHISMQSLHKCPICGNLTYSFDIILDCCLCSASCADSYAEVVKSRIRNA